MRWIIYRPPFRWISGRRLYRPDLCTSRNAQFRRKWRNPRKESFQRLLKREVAIAAKASPLPVIVS